ncbi:lytic transglycosylase domain-containing protein [Paraglaciecola sp. L3A3]|uniref:lytic transglycosylase domain-containing protein n=1 Tax=Paraglaciecola sp. L3A3 TaxID=2686358 RepID=UPI00131D8E49|nr:lytic transglycosylase domain-containing protein [Paraglaciecola sp. L3A3]
MKQSLISKIAGILAIFVSHTVLASFSYDPEEIQRKVIDEAIRQDLAPSLALAIAKVESNFNPQALSHAGAKGVMQIMPRTAELGFGVNRQRLYDPTVNIEVGVKFIKKLLERYDERLDIALSHYNGGSAVRNGYGKLSVIPATRGYVDKVLATQQEFLHHDSLLAVTSKASLVIDDEPNTQNPQVKTLRAIRLHNITRNYKNKKPNKETPNMAAQTIKFTTPLSIQVGIDNRIAKVRQWESIYQN